MSRSIGVSGTPQFPACDHVIGYKTTKHRNHHYAHLLKESQRWYGFTSDHSPLVTFSYCPKCGEKVREGERKT